MILQTRENWKERLPHNTGVMALRFYHSSVTKHIEDAKEDSKCAFKISGPETPFSPK